MSPAFAASLGSREQLDQRAPDPTDMIDHPDETVRRIVLARHGAMLAKLRVWERATGFHFRDDGHVTVAAVFLARRRFMEAGWDTRLVADVDEPFVLWLEIRPAAGCAAPYLGAPLRVDDATLARFRDADGDEYSADTADAGAGDKEDA